MLSLPLMSGYVNLWGKHSVFEAIKQKKRKIARIQCIDSLRDEVAEVLFDAHIDTRNVSLEIVDRNFLNKRFPDVQHQGILLTCSSLSCCKLSLCTHIEPNDRIIALDQINDPHNVGAIIRSMAALGFKHLLMTKDHSPPLDGTVAKNACGALEHIHVIKVTNLADGLIQLKKKGFWVFGLEEHGSKCSDNLKTDGCVLVIGSEGKGIRQRVRSECDAFVKIETETNFSVLNASVAAALGMHIMRTKHETNKNK
ncbi:23S rRNA (guanosine(2251)-2'-O)-methyltransferase RlmB [Candidatus Cytomitobacter indipagum]|uniref:23S rRNA (Guanosine(2251)-2'-O)-methyltransferase RlmB n=1 Tax=Candidatus Cytomitobacter indipagum TaxID=2601575 RepID=A0A5C0UD82_9PROT|nr:23S rRNA (guanosine(2251)-2'-O)-methyltransferase RlmB [Candidatus Cytomitobacter indipagum]QEK37938.1 23S rRNA (guanosine(2251)-2'-O)-methyltransferase RlmB [Candidatus Cytomitobacter indipagum]